MVLKKATEVAFLLSSVLTYIVDVGDKSEGVVYRYILTAICPFSRWAWAIPIMDHTAETVARVLMKHVFCDIAGFPTVLCGPGSIDQAHQPDEYIEASEVEAGERFLQALVNELSS